MCKTIWTIRHLISNSGNEDRMGLYYHVPVPCIDSACDGKLVYDDGTLFAYDSNTLPDGFDFSATDRHCVKYMNTAGTALKATMCGEPKPFVCQFDVSDVAGMVQSVYFP